jgi:thymidylate kinase
VPVHTAQVHGPPAAPAMAHVAVPDDHPRVLIWDGDLDGDRPRLVQVRGAGAAIALVHGDQVGAVRRRASVHDVEARLEFVDGLAVGVSASRSLVVTDLFRGVVLEGVACSGKSTLLRTLLKQDAYLERGGMSSLVLTEHHTQRVLEGLGPRAALRASDHLDLLRGHTAYVRSLASRLSSMRRWREERLPNPRLVAILERFHLSHVVSYAHLEWQDVEAIDADLAEAGMHLCVLRVDPRDLTERLQRDRPGAWGQFLAEAGHRGALASPPSDIEKAEHFIHQQEELLQLAERSRMPRIELNTSDLSPADAAARVMESLGPPNEPRAA